MKVSQDWGLRVCEGKVEVRLMAGEEVEIVLMTPHRSRGRGPGRGLGGRKVWAKAWIIGKADKMLNGCLYE